MPPQSGFAVFILDAEAEANDDWAITWQAPVFPSRSVGKRNASKSRVDGKIVHSAHDIEDRGHLLAPSTNHRSKHSDHSPSRATIRGIASPSIGLFSIHKRLRTHQRHHGSEKVCEHHETMPLLGPRLSSTMLIYGVRSMLESHAIITKVTWYL